MFSRGKNSEQLATTGHKWFPRANVDNSNAIPKTEADNTRWIALFIALCTLLIYIRVLSFTFLGYDDPVYVTDNPMVKRGLSAEGLKWALTTFETGNWHPLTWISNMATWQFFGGNSGAHHIVNALLHAINAVILFYVVLRMTRAPWCSGLVALLFAVHPMHVESVAWVAERKDVLSTLFFLPSCWAYARFTENGRHRRGYYSAALVLMVLSLMSKAMMVTLPFLFLLLDFWPLQRLRTKQDFLLRALEKIPFLIISMAGSVVTFIAQHHEGAVSSVELVPISTRLSNAIVSYAAYVKKFVWPGEMVIMYPFRWDISPALLGTSSAVLLLISGVALWQLRSRPYLFIGWCWFLGTLVPVIGIVQVGAQAMADRYTYVPYIGLGIMLAFALREVVSQKRFVAIGTALAALFSVLTIQQLQHWRNPIALFSHTARVSPNSSFVRMQLASALEAAGQDSAAAEHQQAAVKILENTLRQNPDNTVARNNLAALLSRRGEYVQAIDHYKKALEIDGRNEVAYLGLGITLIKHGNIEEATRVLQEGTDRVPSNASIFYHLGFALAKQKKFPEAERALLEAVRLDPNHIEAHTQLGFVYYSQGDVAKAIAHNQIILRIQPNNERARSNLQFLEQQRR